MLGPRWPCYGRNVEAVVEAGNVFTLELGVPTGAGLVGLEEDVLATVGIAIPEEDDDEVEKFREFLDSVSPDDFVSPDDESKPENG